LIQVIFMTRITGYTFTDESRPPEEFLEQMLAVGADPAYMRCVYQNSIDYARRAIPGQDAVCDNFLGLTGRRPITWTEIAKAHSASVQAMMTGTPAAIFAMPAEHASQTYQVFFERPGIA
jgi:hypothetical protein